VPDCLITGCGTVFELQPNPDGTWSETLIYLFPGGPGDGGTPITPMVFDRRGDLFGTLLCAFDCFNGVGSNVYELIAKPNGSWQYQLLNYTACEACWVAFDSAGRLFLTSQGQDYKGYGVASQTYIPDRTER
jgi:hypothetical protein